MLLIVKVGAYPGVPVLLFGAFFIGVLVPSVEKLYYAKILILFSLLLGSQILTLVLNPNWAMESDRYTFYGLTAIFLGGNGVVVCIILWLLDGRAWCLNDSMSFIKEEF